MTDLLLLTALAGVLSCLVTGLGALPVLLFKKRTQAFQSFACAVSVGMMIAAALFSLVAKSVLIDPWYTVSGVVAGALFLFLLDSYLNPEKKKKAYQQRHPNLFLIAMTLHSIPEGMAIGVGFATGDLGFGLVLALAIAVHNIPEGVAVSLTLAARGRSFWYCFWMSVLSSMPQAVFAVPSLLLASVVSPIQPFGLGVAAGAMVYLAVVELLPESVKLGGRPRTAFGVFIGVSIMYALEWFLQ